MKKQYNEHDIGMFEPVRITVYRSKGSSVRVSTIHAEPVPPGADFDFEECRLCVAGSGELYCNEVPDCQKEKGGPVYRVWKKTDVSNIPTYLKKTRWEKTSPGLGELIHMSVDKNGESV